jgi:hypothetical protein
MPDLPKQVRMRALIDKPGHHAVHMEHHAQNPTPQPQQAFVTIPLLAGPDVVQGMHHKRFHNTPCEAWPK